MLPEAIIRSRLPGRVRLQIQTKKGHADYFQHVDACLKASLPRHRIKVSALTGSVVIQKPLLDLAEVSAAADHDQLFSVRREDGPALPLAKRIAIPIRDANRKIRTVSGGALDISGATFLALLAFGVWELAMGNFRRPPWYTAFWYAFGLFSKTIADELRTDRKQPK